MLYGEHLNADEIAVTCKCGITATVEVVDRVGCSRGWFCRRCAMYKRDELWREEKLARAIVRRKR